ncbi:MAG: DUF3943 domain-containing protein, partial [Treponema sp.]|nr:DUF3943 domain-containing protein [Treponema sp.]
MLTQEGRDGYFEYNVEHHSAKQPVFVIKIIALCLLFSCPASSAFCGEDPAENGTAAPRTENAPPRKRYFLPATGHMIISNGLIFTWNRAVMRSPFSKVSFQSVKDNLKWSAWEWDMDYFPTNFFGHPWHGSTYHAGAAANGFGFYEALLFDGAGSASYELFL